MRGPKRRKRDYRRSPLSAFAPGKWQGRRLACGSEIASIRIVRGNPEVFATVEGTKPTDGKTACVGTGSQEVCLRQSRWSRLRWGFSSSWRCGLPLLRSRRPRHPPTRPRSRAVPSSRPSATASPATRARTAGPFAGGRPIATPFGTIHATNITPDRGHRHRRLVGGGVHARHARRRAARRRSPLSGLPVRPHDQDARGRHQGGLRLHDDAAAGARHRARQRARRSRSTSAPLVAGWKLLFLDQGVLEPDPSQSADWNRGAYLVEGLGHCGACHTPRNALGAEKRDQAYAGGEVRRLDRAGAQRRLARAGAVGRGAAACVSAQRLRRPARRRRRPDGAGGAEPQVGVPDEDVRAIATYVASVAGAAERPERQARAEKAIARAKGRRRRRAPSPTHPIRARRSTPAPARSATAKPAALRSIRALEPRAQLDAAQSAPGQCHPHRPRRHQPVRWQRGGR